MINKKVIISSVVIAIVWVVVFILTQFTIPGILIVGGIITSMPGVNDLVSIIIIGCISLITSVSVFIAKKGIYYGIIILCIGGLLSLNGTMWLARDHFRNNRMNELKTKLEKLRESGALPTTLGEIPSLVNLSSGPFGIDKIVYKISGENFEIESYSVPLGPFELYSSERAEWYYEE